MMIRAGHLSLQIQDTSAQFRADTVKVFDHAKKIGLAWLSGTEANNTAAALIIEEQAKAHDMRFFRGSDCWVAVPNHRIKGRPVADFHKVLDGQKGKFTSKGILRVSWVDYTGEEITVLVGHYLTVRQSVNFPNVNKRMSEVIGELGRKYGAGRKLCFYTGDQNEDDKRLDTFKGQPFTSVPDELKAWEGTHGSRAIDIIATYNADSRVKAVSWRVYGDRVFFLNSDHDYVEAQLEIVLASPPKEKPPLDKSKLANPRLVGDGSPNKHSGTDNKPPKRIVIHSAVMPCEPGRAEQLGRMNQVSRTGSWHYATDPKEAVQCSYDKYVCWHAPPNGRSIGIEMADNPGPWPAGTRTPAWWKALRSRWRWNSKNHSAMLRITARLTAELVVKYDLPVVYRDYKALREGKAGITTHAEVSKAFGQSSHWDPGAWPRYKFMRLVRAEVAKILSD